MYRIDQKKKLITIEAGTLTEQERQEIKDYTEFDNYKTKTVSPRIKNTATINEAAIIRLLETLPNSEEEKEKFDNAKELPAYKKDSNNKYVLDKNGNKVPRNDGSTQGFLGGLAWFKENHEDLYVKYLKDEKQLGALKAHNNSKKKAEEKAEREEIVSKRRQKK